MSTNERHTQDNYITLPDASRKYKINRFKLAEIARNIWFQKKRRGAVIDVNKGGKTNKFVFHEPTLVAFLEHDSSGDCYRTLAKTSTNK